MVMSHSVDCRHPVFVYGTLMRGQRAHHMLQSCPCEGTYLLRDYAMYDLVRYPGIVVSSGESVVGELYLVDDQTLARMDEYEENGSLYHRRYVTVSRGGQERAAQVYVYARSVEGKALKREPWNASDSDPVWYACYGSNLSAGRFSCYISGGVCPDNGKRYPGAADPTPPREEKIILYTGKLYFGNRSASWGGQGVAFFDPQASSPADLVYMRLYRITRSQLRDVQLQEGASAAWYGRLLCLYVDEQGVPVYTLTSETRRSANPPCDSYLRLIRNALCREVSLTPAQADAYLAQWL